MKIKLLLVLILAASLFSAGCGRDEANANVNRNAVVTTPTPVVKTSETAAADPGAKARVEDALKKKGFTDVTVDTTTSPMTLRGTVAKGKLSEVMSTAMEANGGKPVNNQVTEK